MRLLASTTELKQRMGINPDLQGVDGPLELAISAAQLRLQGTMDSVFQETEFEDTFLLDSDSFSGMQPGGLFKVYLSSGLVQAGTVEVFAGENYNEVTTPVPTELFKADLIRGFVLVDAEAYKEQYLRVKFKAGYPEGAAPTINPPDWLVEAILAYAPFAANMGQIGTKDDQDRKDYTAVVAHALAIITPYTRNSGFCLRKLF